MDALEVKGPQAAPEAVRKAEAAEAVGGGYCRLQMPLKLEPVIRRTVAGHKLGTLEGGGGLPPPLPMHPEGWGGAPLCDIPSEVPPPPHAVYGHSNTSLRT